MKIKPYGWALIDSVISLELQYNKYKDENKKLALFSLEQLIKDCEQGIKEGVNVDWFINKMEQAQKWLENS